VTSFLPTIVTSPPDRLARAQRVLLAGPPPGFHGAWPLGLHVEGPFLNPGRKGAHPEDYLRLPDPEIYAHLSPETGVRLVTLAPEMPGALDLVRSLCRKGVIVSAGHSLASFEQSHRAFQAGVRYATHLFNAMTPIHQFEPGLVTAVLSDPGLRFGLIPDGIHVHPALVKLAWELAGAGRMTLVSDGMAALGQGPGRYRLGDLEVLVDETSARLPDGALAGSILPHNTALHNLMAFTGCALEPALACMTSTPADLLGLSANIGALAPGLQADFCLMTPDLQIVQTLIQGRPVQWTT
jgi:N-acetylglucosamine-6-phosphate deacetylase